MPFRISPRRTGQLHAVGLLLATFAAACFDLRAQDSLSAIEATDLYLSAYLKADAASVDRLNRYLRDEGDPQGFDADEVAAMPGAWFQLILLGALEDHGIRTTPRRKARINRIAQAVSDGVRRSRCHALDTAPGDTPLLDRTDRFIGVDGDYTRVRIRCDIPDASVAMRHVVTLLDRQDVSADALIGAMQNLADAMAKAKPQSVLATMPLHRGDSGAWTTTWPTPYWLDYFFGLLKHADAPATAVQAANLYLRAYLDFDPDSQRHLDHYLLSSLPGSGDLDEAGSRVALKAILEGLGQPDAWNESRMEIELPRVMEAIWEEVPGSDTRLFEAIPEERIDRLVKAMRTMLGHANCEATQQTGALRMGSHHKHIQVGIRCQLPDISQTGARIWQRSERGIPATVGDIDELTAALASPRRHLRIGELGLVIAKTNEAWVWYARPNWLVGAVLSMVFEPVDETP